MTHTVTQEDRDAAIYFLKDRLNHNCSAGLDCLYYIEIGLGQADRHVLVQAFARHRIETLERAAEVAEQHRSAFHEQTNRTANAIAAAIRALKEKSDE